MRWCTVDGDEVTITCWVNPDHRIVEHQLFVDGSWAVFEAAPLTQMTYTGTPESRREITDWMIASAALNSSFGYQPGMVLEDGSPGFILRPGMTVFRDVNGKFAAR